MWILHTSDLCFAPSNTESRPLLDSLAKWVLRTTADRPVDFLIIAGNVTLDGRPESFAVACEHLKRFYEAVVMKDPYQDGASVDVLPRLAVAPGSNDCSNEVPPGDLAAFDEFIARVSPGGASSRAVSSPGATCRELKDITIVCVPYWTPATRPPFFDRLPREWETIVLPDVRYARHTPTLLVTAGCPTLGSEGRDVLLEPIRRLCDQVEVELHLFGSGPASALLPVPFGPSRLALGTGPKEPRTPWPFRANLLEVKARHKHGGAKDAGQIFMASHVFQQLRSGEPNWSQHIQKGELDLFFRPQPAARSNSTSYSSFLKEIARHLSTHPYIVVYGLPGIGKREFIKQATKAETWGNSPVQVIYADIKAYDKRSEDDLIKHLAREIEGVSRRQNRQDADRRVVLLLRDRQSSGLASSQRAPLKSFIEDKLNKLVVKHEVSVVLLLTYLDYSLDLSGAMEPLPLPLPPLSPEEMDALIGSYEGSVPIGSPGGGLVEEVSRLTGRYAGYALLVLDRAKEIFGAQPGMEPVTSANSRMLVQRAVQDGELLRESLRAVKIIETMPGGPAVCGYIRHIVRESTAAGGLTERVVLSFAAMCASSPATDPGALKLVCERLLELNVIAARSTSGQYELRLIAPFLPQPWSANPGSTDARPDVKTKVRAGNGTSSTATSNGRERTGATANADILLLTALPEEKAALLSELARLGSCELLDPLPGDALMYTRAVLPFVTAQGRKGQYSVVLASTAAGRMSAATVTTQAVIRWQPKYVVLVGIAGGIADAKVKVGDVLIAEQVFDSGLRKIRDELEQIRWTAFEVDRGLLAATRDWHRRFRAPKRRGTPVPSIHFGTIVSGDDVIASDRFTEAARNVFVHLIGFEMEAAGVADATSSAPSRPRFFMVRAASDLANAHKNTPSVEGRRAHVCEIAAAFVVQLLASGPVAIEAAAAGGGGAGGHGSGSGPTRSRRAKRTAKGSKPPSPKGSIITPDQQDALAGLLRTSPDAMNHNTRRALCHILCVPPDLPFVVAGGSSFGQDLVGYLVDSKNRSGIASLVIRLTECYRNAPVLEELMAITGE